jgi:1-acyl-sn-glycerol-3-phosphate acyltransferase
LLRTLIFNSGFFGGTFVLMLAFCPALIVGRPALRWCGRTWASLLRGWLFYTLGVTVEVRGKVPTGPCVVAAKHQSVWETIDLLGVLPDACFVLKRELAYIPIFGWYIFRNQQITVNRRGGMGALKRMLTQAQRAIAEDRQVVVFPQGTRVEVNSEKPYQRGIAALYGKINVPIIPVALNSGLVWGPNKLMKRKGKIVLEFLPPVPQGLSKEIFLERLSSQIETATGSLVREGHEDYF